MTKGFADGCSSHIKDTYFRQSNLLVPDAPGAFVMENVELRGPDYWLRRAVDVRRRSLAAGVRVAERLRVRRLLTVTRTGCDTSHAPNTRFLPRPALRVRLLGDASSSSTPFSSLFLLLKFYTLFSTATSTSFRRRHGGVNGSLYAAEYVSPATA